MTKKAKKPKAPTVVGVNKWFPVLTSLEVSVLAWHLGLLSWLGLHGFWWTLLGFDALWGLVSATLWVALGHEIRAYEQERRFFVMGAPTAAETREQFLRSFRA